MQLGNARNGTLPFNSNLGPLGLGKAPRLAPIKHIKRRTLLRPGFIVSAQANKIQNTNINENVGAKTVSASHFSKTAEAAESISTSLKQQRQNMHSRSEDTSLPVRPYSRAAPSRAIDTIASATTAATARPPADLRFFMMGAAAAVAMHYVINFIGTLPFIRYLVRRFIWQGREQSTITSEAEVAAAKTAEQTDADEESVEWVNMCWRKAWRVYQRGIERWLADLLQPVFDNLVADGMVPKFVQRIRIAEFTLDHEAPYFTNMRRRNSRKDSDLTGVVDVRYTGGARMLLLIECGTGRWRIKVPVMVSELDLECAMWLKIRLAPMTPWIGTISLAFVGPPTIKVQLSPYNRVRLMRIPILQPFLSKLLTIDLPALMTLPKRLEINIPPAVTAVAEAAVGRDAVMRAVASAVLQADALEHALISALPLGPQGAAGGISLPDLFQGELEIVLKEAKDLPVWGFPWQSNPYCRIFLGSQAVRSRRDSETSLASKHRAPVWNQEFQFLVEDPSVQKLEILVNDSPITGRTEVGRAELLLSQLSPDTTIDVWLPVKSSMPGERTDGAVHLSLTYRPFQDDDADSGFREAALFKQAMGSQDMENEMTVSQITDVKSAADASSRAAVAASAAAAAVAVTKAAAARAAARLARAARGEQNDDNDDNNSNANGGDKQEEQQVTAEEKIVNEAVVVAEAVFETNVIESRNGVHYSENGNSSNGSAPQQQQTEFDLNLLSKIPSATDPVAQEAAVAQLEAMAATMQELTEEVHQLNSEKLRSKGGDAAAAEAAAKAVAAAEALAVTAVVAGDIGAANKALQQAAAALEKTAAKFASTAPSSSSSSLSNGSSTTTTTITKEKEPKIEGQTPEKRAAAALAAAQAAAAAAAAAVGAGPSPSEPLSSIDNDYTSSSEEDILNLLATDAIPSSSSSLKTKDGLLSVSESDLDEENRFSTPAPWWNQALQMVPGVPAAHDAAADAFAEADGSAAAILKSLEEEENNNRENKEKEGGSWWGGAFPGQKKKLSAITEITEQDINSAGAAKPEKQGSDKNSNKEMGPVGDIIISPDIPIEEIAAEVQKSWKLRDIHVEALLSKAVEAQRKKSERPWLVLTAVMSTASAVLLSIVLYRISTGQ